MTAADPRQFADNDAPLGRWIAVDQGLLYDPCAAAGQVVVRDGVAWWVAWDGNEFVLDLTDEGLAEADRRNSRPHRPIPSGQGQS